MTAKVKAPAGGIRKFTIGAATFVSGIVTMSLEMVIGRFFTPYFGGTIYTWGALISVFLLGMTLGYALGGRLADKHPDQRLLAVLFGVAAVPILMFPIFGDDVVNLVLDVIQDTRYAALVSALLLASVPVALLACVSPLCVRLLMDAAHNSGSISGMLSALNTVGCIAGTIGTSFYLVPLFGVRSIFLLLSALSLASALVVLGVLWRKTVVMERAG